MYRIRGDKTGLNPCSFCVHWKALGRKIAGFPVQQGATLASIEIIGQMLQRIMQ